LRKTLWLRGFQRFRMGSFGKKETRIAQSRTSAWLIGILKSKGAKEQNLLANHANWNFGIMELLAIMGLGSSRMQARGGINLFFECVLLCFAVLLCVLMTFLSGEWRTKCGERKHTGGMPVPLGKDQETTRQQDNGLQTRRPVVLSSVVPSSRSACRSQSHGEHDTGLQREGVSR